MDSSMFDKAFESFFLMFAGMVLALVVFVPLGVWKLVEIIIWCCRHLRFAVAP